MLSEGIQRKGNSSGDERIIISDNLVTGEVEIEATELKLILL